MNGAVAHLFHTSSWRGRGKPLEQMEYTAIDLNVWILRLGFIIQQSSSCPLSFLPIRMKPFNDGSKVQILIYTNTANLTL